MNEDLNKSRIININDFIFRQNKEFYPNLQNLECKDNVLTYSLNGTIVAAETITFDLRTLPGHVWNYDCKKFMEVIKFNKDCMALGEVAEFIKEKSSLNSGETHSNVYTNEQIADKTRVYLEGINNIENKDIATDLTEVAQANVKKFELSVMVPYNNGTLESGITSAIKVGEEIYKAEHPEKINTSTNLERTAEMQALHGVSGPVRALVKKEEAPLSLPKAGYINIAILLYGTLNIGIILALALMK